MHCSESAYYDASCIINSTTWNCICPPLPTMEPTAAPVQDGLSEDDKIRFIVGGTFVGFVVLSFIGVVWWYCC